MKTKRLLATITLLIFSVFFTLKLTEDVSAKDWKIEEGEIVYKNSKNTVDMNGIENTNGSFKFPGSDRNGIVFKVKNISVDDGSSGHYSQKEGFNVTSNWKTERCLVPYNHKKELFKNGDCLLRGDDVLDRGKVMSVMYEYLLHADLPNISEVCRKGRGGKLECQVAKKDRKPDDASAYAQAQSEDEASEDGPSCYDGGGAIGWITCPIIMKAAEDINNLYVNVIEPYLQIDNNLIGVDDSSQGTQAAWVQFRNIANLIFIAMFLFVIFSQLTGIGIDNYGIKKALPRLIVMAVLINLSFIICALAVDISNILGFGLRDMLFNLASKIQVASDDLRKANTGGALSWGIVIAAGIVTAAAAIWANPAVVITALIAILATAISILFLFVLLAVRKAAVVLLIAVSPVAIAFYALPNTKSIFDKWLGFLKAMLIMFPAIGLLMGGGQLASAIILTAGETGESRFFLWMVGMVVSIAPIFFVPSVIKSTIAALGSVGARVAGMGSVVSGGIRSKWQKSDYKQTADKIADRKRLMRRAGIKSVDEKGNVTYTNRGMRQNASNRKITNAITGARRGRLMKELRDEGRFDSFASEDGFSAAMQRSVGDTGRREAVDDMITNMKSETNNYDSNTMANMLAETLGGDDIDSQKELKAQALMEKLVESSYGTKLLAGMMSDGNDAYYKDDVQNDRGEIIHKAGDRRISSKGLDFMASVMAKSGTIGGAVARKDGATAQYMRERNVAVAEDKRRLEQHIQGGGTESTFRPSERSTFENWYTAPSAADKNKSNAQFVADDITDDNAGFAAQNDHAIARALGQAGAGRKTGSVISRERAYSMTQNRQINETATEGALINIYRQAGVQRPTGANSNTNTETFTDGAGI